MTELKFVMWNCSGFLSSSSAEEKLHFLEISSHFDVLILVETHHKKLDDISPFFNRYSNNFTILHTEATTSDPYSGIGILVSNRFRIEGCMALYPGRLLNFKLKNSREVYNISVMYGLSGNNVSPESVHLFTEHLISCHSASDLNVILGDFNFVHDDFDRANKNGTGMNQSDKRVAEVWLSFLDRLGLVDPFRVRNPRKRYFSYIHTQHNSKSRLDRLYVNEENCNNVFHYKHILQSSWPKAHRILSFVLRESVERGPGYWKMNTSILMDPAFSVIVQSTVNDILALNIPDPIERWLIFIETIRIEARLYCSKKRSIEVKIRDICVKNIESLEQNPRLGSNTALQSHYDYYKSRLNVWNKKQIEGYRMRIKTQPRFEYGEPQISFFADLERKSAKKKAISHLQGSDGVVKHDTPGLKATALDFYSDLFSAKPCDEKVAQKLLSNVKKQLSPEKRQSLDRLITKEELLDAIMKLKKNKSPGPDGIPAEFYQVFWPFIQDIYYDFLCEVRNTSFPTGKNTSVTTLIYKEKGEIFLLANYRPIALMNVDVKILTKLLAMRLVLVLPSIIHESQTAIYGRRIDDNIHLVRDIIDYANKNDEEAALLFLDQEKAFDRVSHKFLFKVLTAFGFGASFIDWIRVLYSNASTKIDVNGFLTDRVSLKSGVRQGCPLSALLYVLVIEILALQLRANPNIVGFTISNSKVVSSHYADDAVIKITQNRCFKEVYKDLQDYEKASGSKINYEKTKGLWLGKWKNRTDDPFEGLYVDDSRKIKWTSANVKYLGIYVGNSDPDIQTFKEIIPKVKKRLNFWKPLKLPILSKARVIEIFHASKLFFACSFYPLPTTMEEEVRSAFMDYIIFPRNRNEVSRMEMEKLRYFGGIKLINIQLKAQTPKVHWLMRLLVEDHLLIHRNVFNALFGPQPGNVKGEDLIFAEHSFLRNLMIPSGFYREALLGASNFYTYKYYDQIENEHLFYNPIFTTTVEDSIHDRTLSHFRGKGPLSKLTTYGDLLHAEITLTQPKILAALRRKRDSIHNIRDSAPFHLILSRMDGKEYPFKSISQKLIYSELVYAQSKDHGYETRWVLEREPLGLIDWGEVWSNVHDNFHTEEIKSTVWDQIHLNFYTTYNYNKWHNTLHPCPLCRKIPEDVFHIILDCRFTKVMWRRIERVLFRIIPRSPSLHEKAFGIYPINKKLRYAATLRNWLTFFLRHMIMQEEKVAYHSGTPPRAPSFFLKFNERVKEALHLKSIQYRSRGLSKKFEDIVTVNEAVSTVKQGVFSWHDLM